MPDHASQPAFYMSGSDYEGFDMVRSCYRIRDVPDQELVLVKIDPPLNGEDWGMSAISISVVVLASRFQGKTLDQVDEGPVPVNIAIPLSPISKDLPDLRDRASAKFIATAAIYSDAGAAASAVGRIGRHAI